MDDDHLRYSGLPHNRQREIFLDILLSDPLVAAAVVRAHRLALPDWLIVSGMLYNTVWNHLAGKPSGYGIRDVDLFYFDGSDLSWEAEDEVIKRAASSFADLPIPVEIRNQARVHLWYPTKHGHTCPAYANSADSLSYFASKTHAVGLRIDNDEPTLISPFGLDDIFSFRLTPNYALDNRATHLAKGERARSLWPQVNVIDW